MIPSVTIKGSVPVIVKDDRYKQYSENGEQISTWDLMGKLESYDKIYLLDLNGIEKNRPNFDIIQKISSRKEIWADLGARSVETITDTFIAGGDKAVVSTRTMGSLDMLDNALELSEKIILSIVVNDDGILSLYKNIKNISITSLIDHAMDSGVDKVVIISLSDRGLNGVPLSDLTDENYQLYIGGVTKRIEYYDDIVDGVLLGIEEAIEYQKKN